MPNENDEYLKSVVFFFLMAEAFSCFGGGERRRRVGEELCFFFFCAPSVLKGRVWSRRRPRGQEKCPNWLCAGAFKIFVLGAMGGCESNELLHKFFFYFYFVLNKGIDGFWRLFCSCFFSSGFFKGGNTADWVA